MVPNASPVAMSPRSPRASPVAMSPRHSLLPMTPMRAVAGTNENSELQSLQAEVVELEGIVQKMEARQQNKDAVAFDSPLVSSHSGLSEQRYAAYAGVFFGLVGIGAVVLRSASHGFGDIRENASARSRLAAVRMSASGTVVAEESKVSEKSAQDKQAATLALVDPLKDGTLRESVAALTATSVPAALRLGAPAAPRLGAIPTVEERTTTRERTKYNVGSSSTRSSNVRKGPSDFEWAIDTDASRQDGDNFHILLLKETFEKPRMSVAYVAGALTLVLAMPEPEALEHAGFAQAQGFSCLGTWRRDESLKYCEQLKGRDLSVRAIPGIRGRQSWQGEPANASPDALPSTPSAT